MLKTLACFKWVIDDADIRVDPASGRLALDRAGYKINAYDRNAIEEAVRLRERHGGTVTALTVAAPAAKACLKDALARGPDAACFINDPTFAALAPLQTASLLAAAIRSGIDYDLIICGEGSGDLYNQQVGPVLAEILGIPCATFVNKLSFSGGEIIAERKLEGEIETVGVKLPALVTILPGINTPRIPSLKQVLGAAKKPVKNLGSEVLGPLCDPRIQTAGVIAATMDRKRVKFAADSNGIRAAVSALIKEGVLA